MSGGFGVALGADVAGAAAPGWAVTMLGVGAAPPSTRIGIASLFKVTYCSFCGSKNEKTKDEIACFFSFGERTVSNIFSPLIPTLSSCLNLEEGGYLCQ